MRSGYTDVYIMSILYKVRARVFVCGLFMFKTFPLKIIHYTLPCYIQYTILYFKGMGAVKKITYWYFES